MPEFICTQCRKNPTDGDRCKANTDYDGYAAGPTGCLYASMRKAGYTGDWKPYVRKRKVK